MTKKEKIIIYKCALGLISDRRYKFSLCPAFLVYSKAKNVRDVQKMFPEIMKYKPTGKTKTDYWWPITHRKKRIKILQEIIEQLENKNKNDQPS